MVTGQHVGVDWITGTTKDDKVGLRWLETIKTEQAKLLKTDGERYGYSRYGYQGFQVGGLVWAYSQKWGYLCQVAGQDAWRLYPQIHSPLSRFTRLDLQVTVECDPPEPHYISDVFQAHKNDELPAFTYWEKQGTSTCYVGSRQSERFGRIYDKGLESGIADHAGRYIRYEVEVKGEVARRFEGSMGLSDLMQKDRVEARMKVSDFVYGYFKQRGVEMLFNGLPGVAIEVGRRTSTAETKLAWIQSSVRSSVQFLVDAGYSDRLVDAMGLTEGQAVELAKALTDYSQLPMFDDA